MKKNALPPMRLINDQNFKNEIKKEMMVKLDDEK